MYVQVAYTVNSNPVTVWECAGCGALPDDLAVWERVAGLATHRAREAEEVFGVCRYDRLPGTDPRRRLTRTPFEYLGDLGRLRRRAFALWPDARDWRNRTVWQAVKEDVEAATREPVAARTH